MSSNDGLLFVQLYYPGNFLLSTEFNLLFEKNNKPVFLQLKRVIDSLEILDLDNSLISKRKGKKEALFIKNSIKKITQPNISVRKKSTGTITKVIEHSKHRYRTMAMKKYSEIFITYEVENVNEVTDEVLNFYRIALDKFILMYKTSTQDVNIRYTHENYNENIVLRTSIYKYSESDKALSLLKRITKERDLHFQVKRFNYNLENKGLQKESKDVEENNKKLKDFITNDYKILIHDQLFLRGYEDLIIHSNYKMAYLNLFSSFEIYLEDYLANYKKEIGISNTKLKDYKTEVGISYKMNIELPMVMEEEFKSVKPFIGDLNKIRKKRNDMGAFPKTRSFSMLI